MCQHLHQCRVRRVKQCSSQKTRIRTASLLCCLTASAIFCSSLWRSAAQSIASLPSDCTLMESERLSFSRDWHFLQSPSLPAAGTSDLRLCGSEVKGRRTASSGKPAGVRPGWPTPSRLEDEQRSKKKETCSQAELRCNRSWRKSTAAEREPRHLESCLGHQYPVRLTMPSHLQPGPALPVVGGSHPSSTSMLEQQMEEQSHKHGSEGVQLLVWLLLVAIYTM